MNENFWKGLAGETDLVFGSNAHLCDHRDAYPWLIGSLGDPFAGIWFIAENPSLLQIERVKNPDGGQPTPEAQWWASAGDKLFREMLVKFSFKNGSIDSPGGWNCYITNVIKEADYTKDWRNKSQDLRNEAAVVWSGLLNWELSNSKPKMVVVMGSQTDKLLRFLSQTGRISLPRVEYLTHYAYIGQRPQGKLGPMHPQRVEKYQEEFAHIRGMFDTLLSQKV